MYHTLCIKSYTVYMLGIKSCIKCYTNIVFFHKGTEHDTMSDGFTTIAILKKAAFFFIDRKEWDELKRKWQQRRFKGLQWTNLISKRIRSIHPYCSIFFRGHTLKVSGSQKPGPESSCLGYCSP